MSFIRSAYTKSARAIEDHGLVLYADIVILFSSGYLLTKKAFNFSLSGWLAENAFKQNLVNFIVIAGALVIISAITIKGLSLITKKFPYKAHQTATPDMISECLQIINSEIVQHLQKCDENQKPRLRNLKDEHRFKINLRVIVSCLAEQIKQSASTIKIKNRDIFISLYHYDTTDNCLEYELHYDPKKDSVKSKRIPLDNRRFSGYECVKCTKSTDSTIYALEKKNITKGHSKRFKTVKHYMGCKLEGNGYIFGFLNVEFHNHIVFTNEEEMQDFMEENIFPFKQLIEYQYLKREFFGKFENLEINWETA
ncbi:hypothetical protein LG325_03300 [Marinobacter nauticus]